MRKTLIVIGAVLALLLLLLVLLPVLFGGRIAERVKTEANRSLNAKVDWRDAGLSLFGDFPNLTLDLDGLTVVGVGKFDGDTLAAIRHLGVVLDLASAVRSALGGSGPVVVRAIELDQPRLSLVKLKDGSANWDITKPDTAAAPADTAAGRAMAISLRRFDIDSGVVAVDNQAGNLKASVVGFDQSLSGDFGDEQLTIRTRAHADEVSVEFAGIPYLRKVRLDASSDVAADLAKKSFTLKESGVRLNELTLAFSGSVASAGERLALDLAFGAPKTEFKHILSLVPAVYARDFASVQTSGSLAVSGKVKGEYADDAFPSLTLNAKVENGTFRYPDLPLPARDIALDLAITNPGGDADSTTVNLRRFHVVLGQNPVDAVLVVRTPISDPDVDARFAGKVDLGDLRRTMKLEGMQELAGTIAADAAVRTRMSWLDSANPQYDRIAARGTVNVAGLTVKSDSLPHPLSIREASLSLAPTSAELRSFDATIGSSDMRLSGRIDNLLGFALRDEVLRGSATLASRRFNLNEWRSDEGELSVIPVPANLDFSFNATMNEVLYDNLTLRDARGRLRVKDQRITLQDFTFNTLGGGFALTGFYDTRNIAVPTFDVGIKIQKLEIPKAFEAFTTVQMLAPVAKYARGTFSTDLKLSGVLGKDMMPVFPSLKGQGGVQTSILRLQDFPPLDKVASLTKLSLLEDPGLKAVKSQFAIRDGRLQVQPFDVGIGPTSMRVSGSNGIDQSIDYDLSLKVPRSLLGAEANQAISGLISKAEGAGVNLQAAQEIALGIKLGGSVTNPSVSTNVGSVAGSTAQAAGEAVREAAEQQVDKAVDSAKQRASAEAAKLVAEAEKQAASIRAEGNALAEKVKKEGYLQADSLVAKSEGPLAQMAAKVAADRLRKETDSKAAGIVKEADTRANSLVAEAKKKAAVSP
ncbi:MAG TPA: AsmA-like C-terminal region-containing protein [Gemmatimonadales bacterium]|nr:AsmA-like C-terminal region-containing protein [Gemmatimonadales bacterium]